MTRVLNLVCIILCFGQAAVAQKKVNVRTIQVDSTFDEVSASRLEIAAKELERIFNSEEFAKAVLHEKFNVGNYQKTSAEIYELIVSGMNNYKNSLKDGTIDLHVAVFDKYAGSGNFGITNMTTRVTRTHRCYILHNDIKCYISHLAHEYMHQIGFVDEKTWIFGKKTSSVPYKIGNIVNKLTGNTTSCEAKDQTCTKSP